MCKLNASPTAKSRETTSLIFGEYCGTAMMTLIKMVEFISENVAIYFIVEWTEHGLKFIYYYFTFSRRLLCSTTYKYMEYSPNKYQFNLRTKKERYEYGTRNGYNGSIDMTIRWWHTLTIAIDYLLN